MFAPLLSAIYPHDLTAAELRQASTEYCRLQDQFPLFCLHPNMKVSRCTAHRALGRSLLNQAGMTINQKPAEEGIAFCTKLARAEQGVSVAVPARSATPTAEQQTRWTWQSQF
jgi:hypothetical protein